MAWANGEFITLDLGDEVAHVIGSSSQKSKEGSWKKYWINHTGRQFPQKCQIYSCGNPAVLGAHVYLKHLRQNFILPTCHDCNMDPEQAYGDSDNWVSVKANAVVVRVKPHSNTFE
jgi:hypothetical protein